MASIWHLFSPFLLGVALLWLRYYMTEAAYSRKHGCKRLPTTTKGIRLYGLDISYLLFGQSQSGGLDKLPLQKQFEILGPTFQSQIGLRSIIRTSDPRNIEAVLSDGVQFGVRPLRHFAFYPLVGDGIMTLDGSRHERARGLIRPTFSRKHLENEAAYDRHVQKLINLLPTDGSTVDLQPLFERLDLDSSTEFIFGESVASLDDPPDLVVARHPFPAAFNVAQRGMAARFRMLPFNILHRDEQFWEACRTIRQFITQSIDKANKRRKIQETQNRDGINSAKSYILIDNLLDTTQDITEIQDTLMNTFLPGHDTVAILLSNIFFHLARNPDTWRKLRQQLVDLSEIKTDSLKRVKYLQYVINETLRVSPPVYDMSRIAMQNTVLPVGGGPDQKAAVFVPKGTVIASSIYNVHRRAEIYGEDVETWRPERWEHLKLSSNLAWNFVPFSGGPHVCPGQGLALNRVAFTVARLVRAFERIENRDPVREFVPLFKLVTASQNGVKVGLFV